jgi:peptide/nickel transport system substrate-binding protein
MKRGAWKTLAIAAVVGVSLSACAGGGSSGQTAAKNVLNYAVETQIQTIDPLARNAQKEGERFYPMMYDRLVTKDATGKILPDIATSWKLTSDDTWVFTLRKDVKFSDGTPLTAKDAAASINSIKGDTVAVGSFWAPLDKATALNDYTLQITTTSPFNSLLTSATFTYIIPAAGAKDPTAFAKHPIGSGPYKFVDWKHGQVVTLTRNDKYWAGTEPAIKTLNYYEIPEESSRVTGLINGSLDIIPDVSSDDISTINSNANTKIDIVPSYQFYYLWPYQGKPIFKDLKVRQAMFMAIDRPEIVKELFPDGAPMTSEVSKIATDYQKQSNAYDYNPTKAKQLLAEDGHASGLSFSLEWQTDSGPNIEDLATAIASDWAKIGIKITLKPVDAAAYTQDRLDGKYDLALGLVTGLGGDTASTMSRIYLCSETRLKHCEPSLEKVVAQANSTSDPDQASTLWKQAEKLAWDDVACFWIAEVPSVYGVRKDVKGFDPGPAVEKPELTGITKG